MGPTTPAILVLATADWNAPLWTNKQHVAVELARQWDVTYVNSVGLRRPRLTRADLRRAAARVRRRAGAGKELYHPRINVVSPWAIPQAKGFAARAWNRRVLRAQVRRWAASPSPRVLWTYNPATFGLDELADVVIYHCVDLLSYSPGADGEAVAEDERRLAENATASIASSAVVQEHLRVMGFARPLLWENVANTRVYSEASRPPDLRNQKQVVFSGHVTTEKIDVPLLEAIARDPRFELHIAGPVALDGTTSIESRLRSAGATLHGALSSDRLADLVGTSQVGLIPYRLTESNKGVFPLKLYEYLAGGVRVVATPIPSVLAKAIDLHALTCAPADEFVECVAASLLRGPPDPLSREDLAEHSWSRRGEHIRELVQTLSDDWAESSE